ncbi:MAG: hypothetical protein QM683_10840 [Lacrimispora sp.]
MQNKRFESLKGCAEEYMRRYDAVYVTEYMEMNCREERMAVLYADLCKSCSHS